MKKQFLTMGIVFCSFMLPVKATAASLFSELYIFGDSLSDTGNAFNATGGAVPPYPDGNGRFSNGQIWVEYLAQELGLTPNQSTNFAFGGSTTGTTNTIVPALPGLEQQINGFTATNPVADPDKLYIVWAGSNDYLGGGITNPSEPLTNLANAVTALAGVGAQNIMVVNLPDLGNLPVTVNTPNSAALNTLTRFHNDGLTQTLNNLSQNLAPNVNFIPLDLNSLLSDAINNPVNFGFTNVTEGCLLVGCTNPDEYLFWDTIHPTTAAHQFIGELAFNTLQPNSPASVPEPTFALGILAFGALATKEMFKRKLSTSGDCQR